MAAIRISLKFRRLPASALYVFGTGVFNSMSGNSHFPSPTVDLADLKTACEALEHASGRAQGGGAMVVADKEAKRMALVNLLRELAAYVQFISKGDEVMARSSGFDIASRNTAKSPLASPRLGNIVNVASTKLGLKLTPVKNAKVYEVGLRWGGGEWRLWQTFLNTRRMVLTGLTPGTMYEIRARAVGGSTGYSDWCDATFHMST